MALTTPAMGATARLHIVAVSESRTANSACTIAVSLLEEPLPLERLACDPVHKLGIHLGSNRLYYVEGEAVPISGIDVQDAQARIEAERSTQCSI